MNPATIAALVAAILGPLIAYITASRKLSGRINTSEASQLWTEAGNIRQEYRDRIAHSEERQAALEERVANLEKQNNDLARENIDLKRRNAELELDLARIKERCDGLERENDHLKNTIRRLGIDAGS